PGAGGRRLQPAPAGLRQPPALATGRLATPGRPHPAGTVRLATSARPPPPALPAGGAGVPRPRLPDRPGGAVVRPPRPPAPRAGHREGVVVVAKPGESRPQPHPRG